MLKKHCLLLLHGKPAKILLGEKIYIFPADKHPVQLYVYRVDDTFQTTTETSFRAQFCSQKVHLYFHVFCTTCSSCRCQLYQPLFYTILYCRLGKHHMTAYQFTSNTWENGSLKDVVSSDHKIFSHTASRSRNKILLFGNSRHAFTWCCLCNGFLYATLPYRTALILWTTSASKTTVFCGISNVFFFYFYGLLISNLTSWKPQIHAQNICLSFWFAWFDFPRPRQWLKSDPWNGFWKYDPPPEIHLRLPAISLSGFILQNNCPKYMARFNWFWMNLQHCMKLI